MNIAMIPTIKPPMVVTMAWYIPSLNADISPDAKAKEWPLYDLDDKQVMVLDEFDIHPAKESEVKIVDWESTYFLTKYYCN